MKRSNTQWLRLIELDKELREAKFPNCSLLANRFEVSTKTILRDIDFLRDQLGAPVKYDARKRGYYYSDPVYMLPSVAMSEGELLALMVGTQALYGLRGTPIADQLKLVLGKLSEVLPDEISLRPLELFSNFSFSSPPSLPLKSGTWETVIKALLSKRQMEIIYHGKVSRIHPLHIANLQGEWYLFVRFFDYDNFRQISMGRIEEAKLLDKRVNSSGFDPEVFLSDTLYRFAGDNEPFSVTLLFDTEVSDAVLEREWHPNQKTEELPDGRVRLTFSAKGRIEVKRWILAWGRHCSVESPSWLKTMLNEEIQAMLLSHLPEGHPSE